MGTVHAIVLLSGVTRTRVCVIGQALGVTSGGLDLHVQIVTKVWPHLQFQVCYIRHRYRYIYGVQNFNSRVIATWCSNNITN